MIERIVGVYHSRREAKDDHIVIFAVRTEVRASGNISRADVTEIEDARWFPLDRLSPNTSAATVKRIAEYRAGTTGLGTW